MMVELILRESIKKLGKVGEVVRVRSGYARNFLLPQRKAIRACDANLKLFEAQRLEFESLNTKKVQEAQALALELKGYMLILLRQAGESGQLYGSITARDIVQAFQARGIVIHKEQVVLNTPLKTLGVHTIELELHADVMASVTLIVGKTQEEADVTKQKLLQGMASQSDEEIQDQLDTQHLT